MSIKVGDIRKMVKEEIAKLVRENDELETPEERVEDTAEMDVEAGDLADQLEKPIDMMAALKIKEARLLAVNAKVAKRLQEVHALKEKLVKQAKQSKRAK